MYEIYNVGPYRSVREAADNIRGLTFEYNHIAALGVPVVKHWG